MGGVSYLLLSGVIVLLDRLLKGWAAASLAPAASRPLLGEVIRLTRVHNVGGAFGIFPGNGVLFLTVSFIVSIALVVLFLAVPLRGTLLKTGLSLVLGGAVGNLIDRLQFGYVLDFFEVRGFSIFNLADACLTMGIGFILVHALFGGERDRAARPVDRL